MSDDDHTTQDPFVLSTAPPEDKKERTKRLAKAWHEANKDKVAARHKASHQANKERNQARHKEWNHANRDKVAVQTKVYRERNKDAIRERRKRFREANLQRLVASQKRSRLKCRYGVSQDDIDAMIRDQSGRCKCCNTKFGLVKGQKPRIDHCHKTGIVRGVLCNHCNTLLGHSQDNVQLLRACIKYLKKSESSRQLKAADS